MSKTCVALCLAAIGFVFNTATAVASEAVARKVSERVIVEISPGRLSQLIISPDGRRVAYIATADGKVFDPNVGETGEVVVILDGKKGKRYGNIVSPFFSPDSKRLAYTVSHSNPNQLFVVVDGHEGEHYQEAGIGNEIRDIAIPTFSPDSKRFAYVASNRDAAGPSFVVVDGQKDKSYASINQLTFSPDSKRIAYVAVHYSSQDQFVVVDGQEGKRYHSIASDSGLVFSPDSKRLAYKASQRTSQEQQLFVVVDGKEGKRYPGMKEYLAFSPDSRRLSFVAQIAFWKWSVVVDGNEDKHYETWTIHQPVFSPDSQRVAYVVDTAPDGGGRFVIVNGQESKRYSGKQAWMNHVLFSPDSKRMVYLASADEAWLIVADGKNGKPYEGVDEIAFSPDSSRLAYVAQTGTKQFVVLDGNEGKHYDAVRDLVFSPNGKTLAYAAYTKKYKRWCVVINGQEGTAYDLVLAKNVFDEAARRSTKSGSLRFDAPDRLRYLVMKDKRTIALVEEKLSLSETYTAVQPRNDIHATACEKCPAQSH